MLAAFGVDVLDPRTSLRRVHVLLERLPPHARRGGEQWSTEAELLAGLTDHVAFLTFVTLRAHGAKSAKRPKPVRRPPLRAAAPEAVRRDANRVTRKALPPAKADAPVKTSSWGAAIAQIAGSEGVRVRRG
jgi:hypothetical protein